MQSDCDDALSCGTASLASGDATLAHPDPTPFVFVDDLVATRTWSRTRRSRGLPPLFAGDEIDAVAACEETVAPGDGHAAAVEGERILRPTVDTHPRSLWRSHPHVQHAGGYSYSRILACWHTRSLHFSYLRELRCFRDDTAACTAVSNPQKSIPTAEQRATRMSDVTGTRLGDRLDGMSREARQRRCQWAVDNPDIVAFMHALRVEQSVTEVMAHVVDRSLTSRFNIGCASSLATAATRARMANATWEATLDSTKS